MDLSVRALNCLKAANIDTFADLVSHQRGELMKFRNFGKKSMNEIEMLIEKVKLNFGMDVTKYGIEPKQSAPEDAAADNEKETETTETELENYEA
jgi:DNA-directed RNA polymerase subunit alpha